MTNSEPHYETRKELLAVVYGLKQYRQYLLGGHFVMQTDLAALSWVQKLARWLTIIEQLETVSIAKPLQILQHAQNP